MNNELIFSPKLRGVRSRLYRLRFLQVNTRWNCKALAEIYTMDSFAPSFNLKISAKKKRQHLSRLNIGFPIFIFVVSNFAFFEFFSSNF